MHPAYERVEPHATPRHALGRYAPYVKFAIREGALFADSFVWGVWMLYDLVPWIANGLNPSVVSPAPQLVWVRFGGALLASIILFTLYFLMLIVHKAWFSRSNTPLDSAWVWKRFRKESFAFGWDAITFVFAYLLAGFLSGTATDFLASKVAGSLHTSQYNATVESAGDSFAAVAAVCTLLIIGWGVYALVKGAGIYSSPDLREVENRERQNNLKTSAESRRLRMTESPSVPAAVIKFYKRMRRDARFVQFLRRSFNYVPGYCVGNWLSFTFLPLATINVGSASAPLAGEKLLATLVFTTAALLFWVWFEVANEDAALRREYEQRRAIWTYLKMMNGGSKEVIDERTNVPAVNGVFVEKIEKIGDRNVPVVKERTGRQKFKYPFSKSEHGGGGVESRTVMDYGILHEQSETLMKYDYAHPYYVYVDIRREPVPMARRALWVRVMSAIRAVVTFATAFLIAMFFTFGVAYPIGASFVVGGFAPPPAVAWPANRTGETFFSTLWMGAILVLLTSEQFAHVLSGSHSKLKSASRDFEREHENDNAWGRLNFTKLFTQRFRADELRRPQDRDFRDYVESEYPHDEKTFIKYWTVHFSLVFSFAFLWGWFLAYEVINYFCNAWGYLPRSDEHVFVMLGANCITTLILGVVYLIYLVFAVDDLVPAYRAQDARDAFYARVERDELANDLGAAFSGPDARFVNLNTGVGQSDFPLDPEHDLERTMQLHALNPAPNDPRIPPGVPFVVRPPNSDTERKKKKKKLSDAEIGLIETHGNHLGKRPDGTTGRIRLGYGPSN